MKINNSVKIVVVLLFLGISQSTFAKNYIVEMIFFADTHDLPNDSMRISIQAINPDLEGAIMLDESALTFGFIPYQKDTLTLVDQAAALSETGRYRVLEHIAWLQPGLAKEDAIAIRIHAGKDYSEEFKERSFVRVDFNGWQLIQSHPVNELDGTIKVVLGRYLHVYTDLAYRRPFAMPADAEHNPLGREHILADFNVKAHRKMRSEELHYIDHPLLGILVEIRPDETQID